MPLICSVSRTNTRNIVRVLRKQFASGVEVGIEIPGPSFRHESVESGDIETSKLFTRNNCPRSQNNFGRFRASRRSSNVENLSTASGALDFSQERQ